VQVSVVIGEVESITADPNAIAAAVLDAIGGDPTTDFCVVSFTPPLALPFGKAGKDPNLAEESS
jgi:S1-C subfamily serine protease